jgi:pimeloyl-ACP methyl ester carboxylesterase
MSQQQAVVNQPRNVDQRQRRAASADPRGRLLKGVPIQARCLNVNGIATSVQIPDAELRRIEVPTALRWGRHDRMSPLRLAQRANARLGWPLHVIDDAGHVPHIEQPNAFLAALHGAHASPQR